MKIAFFLSVAIVIYVYAGYPLAVFLFGKIRSRNVRKQHYQPAVTVVIAAYNEKDTIADTVRNKLGQDYPPDLLDIIVISDGSMDGTDEIVSGLGSPRVRLIRQNPRAGKTSALNKAVPIAKGEIVVFSDANSIYANDAVKKLMGNFSDPEVGYVTGRMIYVNPDGSPVGEGCTAYMKYENALRAAETRIGSIVGVDGGIDAVRKSLYSPMGPDQLPDFVLPLKVIEQGFRVIYEKDAILRESVLKEAGDEYRMRVRVSLRSLWALFTMRKLLNPMFNPLFAWQLWSHKALRYLCFFFLAAALITNIMLINKGFIYQAALFFQTGNYLAAILASKWQFHGSWARFVVLPRYFVLLNLAAAHAFFKFLLGKKQVMWTPRKG